MTIYIKKDSINTCMFTLNESTTIDGASYIIQFESKALNTSKIMWLQLDVSPNPERYNEYIIQEVPLDEEDLEEQKINLLEGGYTYFVWETTSENLNLNDAQGIIESGMVHVIGDAPIINTAQVTPSSKHIFKP